MRLLPPIVLALVLAGCIDAPDYEGRLCSADQPCPIGYHCSLEGRCRAHFDELPDAEIVDAGRVDSGLPSSITLRVPIAASEDDALQNPNGELIPTYPWISLYSVDHWGATRFLLRTLTSTAVIDDAYLEVVVDSTTEDSPNLRLFVQPTPSPAPLGTLPFDISTRALGATASVDWTATHIGDGRQQSPSVAELVRSVVNHPSWTPGSYVMFIWDDLGAEQFEFHQRDYAVSDAPILVITYR